MQKFRITKMHTQQSPAPSADRRLSVLARHLEPSSSAAVEGHSNHFIVAAPTSGYDGKQSVFSHIVRAPEDPILGVNLSLPL